MENCTLVIEWRACPHFLALPPQTNNVRILEPEGIAGVYSSATANFGVPLYGFSLYGEVFYPELKDNQLGCSYEPGFRVRRAVCERTNIDA